MLACLHASGGDLMYHDSNGRRDVPFAFSSRSPRQPAIIVTATHRCDSLSFILSDKDPPLSPPPALLSPLAQKTRVPFEQDRDQFWCIASALRYPSRPFRASRPRVARDFISFTLIAKLAVSCSSFSRPAPPPSSSL